MDTEGPAIVQLIIQGIETTEICRLLHLCDQSQNKMLETSLTSFGDKHSNPVVAKLEKNENCATCNYYVSIVLEQASSTGDHIQNEKY